MRNLRERFRVRSVIVIAGIRCTVAGLPLAMVAVTAHAACPATWGPSSLVPISLAASSQVSSPVHFSWPAVAGADSYGVGILDGFTGPSSTFRTRVTTTGTSADVDLPPQDALGAAR